MQTHGDCNIYFMWIVTVFNEAQTPNAFGTLALKLRLGSRFVSTWSRSRLSISTPKKVSLDGRENLDSFKKLVSTIEISRSRSRYHNFVSTPPSSPKSLDRDREIRRDMTFLANLDSLFRSRSRVSQFYHIYWSRFLNLSRFLILKYLKKSR